MKKIFTFCVSLLAALSVFAYDFQSGDLFYNITSSSAPYTVEVTQQSQYYNSNYSGVDTIVIPETVTYNAIIYSVTSIGESAFDHSKLTTITIPNTVTSIGEYAFAYCQKLTSVAIGSGVKTIHMAAFNNCSALRTITIPANVKEIYNQAFTGASISTIYMEGTTPPSLLQSKSDGSAFMIFSTTPTCYVPCSAVASYKASTKWKGAVREFVAEFPYTFTIASANTSLGTIAITQQPDCSTAAIFEAIPNTGCYFTQWSDGNTDNPRTLKVTQDTRLTASFASSTYVVNLIAGANGAVSGAGTYDHGTTATITAIPNDGYHFTQWSDGNTDNPRSIVVVEPISLTALFEENYTQEHCQIIYTSTDGDVVTPWVTYNFGADIVSNTYADGQGVITFDGPVTAIGDTAFANCSSLESIIIPDRVTVIGDQAFQYCTYLKDVTIGNRVESIGTAAFNNCSSLQSITIPQSVKYIYNYAFVGASLSSIYVNRTTPPALNPKREDPYMVLGTDMVNVCYIPCGNLASYQISEWKTKGQVREFVERPSYLLTVQSVDKTMGTATITQDIDCETQIATIAATPYDGYRFVQWSDGNTDNPRSWVVTEDTYLEAIFEKSIDPTWQITYTSTDGNIVTPSNETDVFGANIVNNEYKDGQGVITFDGPVTSIGIVAFMDCSSLSSITIPNSVTSIGDRAFMSCESLTSITIPNSVTSIWYHAFEYCTSLTSITIPNSVTSIGYGAFSGCRSLASITIPNSVTSIGDWAFFGCTSLASVTIPNSVTSIGVKAFSYCTSLTSMVVEPSNTTYDSRENCNAIIEKVTNTLIAGCQNTIIPNTVTSIGEYAFYHCKSLTSITIPNSVTSIGEGAFEHCYSLTSITCEATTPPTLQSYVFPSELTTAYIPCGTKEAYEASDWASYSITSFIEEDCPEPIDPTWQITYTSTDGNIVTPNDENVFGANIVSNTYQDGQGVITFDGPVTSIGDYAFYYDCTSLTSIAIPNSVTSIGVHAFIHCISLTSLTIPKSVTSIGYGAFSACSSLTSIVVEDGNTHYDSRENCNAIIETASNTLIAGCQNTIIPNSINVIGEGAFSGCSSLTSITIPDGVQSIWDDAFWLCSSLTSITIGNSVASIGETVFGYCTNLTSIVVEDGNTTYDSRNNCNAIIETESNTLIAGCPNTIIPNSVETIGDYAFAYYTSPTSVNIPNSVTGIEEHAFLTCDATSITIGNSVTSIGDYAFYDCSSLTSITIGNSVTSIGDFAFGSCDALYSVYIEATTPPALGYEALEETSSPICYIPCGTKAAYEASDWASQIGEFVEECEEEQKILYTSTDGNIVTPNETDVFGANIVSNIYQDGQGVITFDGPVTSIGDDAFHFCQNLASIFIPNSVTSIGSSAFYSCDSLASITIPSSVTVIGDAAFSDCSSLTSIEIPNSVTSIHTFAFARCSSLVEIEIPKSVISIGDSDDGRLWACQGIFMGCNNLQKIVVKEGNPIFDSRDNCNAIIETATNTLIAGCSNTEIPNGIKKIGTGAFRDCNALGDIDIPSSVNVIGYAAFYGTGITNVVIPSNCIVEDADATYSSTYTVLFGAFARCEQLTEVVIPEGTTRIASGMLAGCSSLESLIIPASVTSIGEWAFYDCDALTSITIPNDVTSIEEGTFMRCSKLTSITIPSGVTNIGYKAFGECILLSSVICEATTPPMLEDLKGSPVFTSSPICYIPCGTKAAYEASNWAQYVSEFVEEGCSPIQKCGDDLYWEYADGVLIITGTGDMYDYAKDTDVPWYDVRGNIKTVSLPDAMTKIGQNAFYKCTVMTSINMPTSLTAIGEKAFAQDTKLACEIILPASMTNIATRAFFNCQAVTAFHIEATTPPTIPNDAFERTTAPIHVPCGYGHVYGKHTQWGMLNLEMCELLQDNVYYYPIDGHTARAVTYHSNPTDTIVIPSAVVIDGMPRTVTEVADFAFTDCKDIPAIIFNEGLEYIGERAFVRCYGLHGTIVLPATLETIGERAFSYCNNVEKYLIQAMTPPALGANAFTGDNKNALFYISCEAMDDYKVATNWSSLKSRLRDACLNIYHYNTPLGTNGVYTTEDTLVASIYYRRQFTPYRWETLYLPFEVDRVTVLEDGVEYDLTAWDIVDGGHYFLAKPDGMLNKEILFGFTDELESHTPYIIQFSDAYYTDKLITFYGKESWNKLSTSFEVLSSSAWMQIAGNTTLQDQLLEKPVYMLRSGLDFILQKTTTTLHPFECYVMPYTAQSGAPARMNVRLRDDVATAVESVKGNESHLTYSVDGYTLTVYPQGQAFSIYSLNGALIYSCEAGKETVDCELNSGCYLLHAGAEAHKIML